MRLHSMPSRRVPRLADLIQRVEKDYWSVMERAPSSISATMVKTCPKYAIGAGQPAAADSFESAAVER